MCACAPWRPGEVVGSPGAGVSSCLGVSSSKYWLLKSISREEQCVLYRQVTVSAPSPCSPHAALTSAASSFASLPQAVWMRCLSAHHSDFLLPLPHLTWKDPRTKLSSALSTEALGAGWCALCPEEVQSQVLQKLGSCRNWRVLFCTRLVLVRCVWGGLVFKLALKIWLPEVLYETLIG